MLVVDKQPAKSIFFKLIYVCESFEPGYLGETFNNFAFHITFAAFYAFYSLQKPKPFIV